MYKYCFLVEFKTKRRVALEVGCIQPDKKGSNDI